MTPDGQVVSQARHSRQRFDVGNDRLQRILGRRGTFSYHDRDRLTDVTHLAAGNHGLLIGREGRQQFLPHRDERHIDDVGRGDRRHHAWAGTGGANIDRTNTSVRYRASKNRGMQNAIGGNIVNKLSAPAQKAQVLQALDRAAHKGVDRALVIHAPGSVAEPDWHLPRAHITIVEFSLSSARATLMAASAEVLGFEREGLPWS